MLAPLLLALALAACGGDADRGPAAGPLGVAEALAAEPEGAVVVRGTLFAVEGEPVRLCEAILESYPPQCGEPSLEVEGLHPAAVPGLATEGAVAWAESVELRGELDGDVLRVDQAQSSAATAR